MSGAWITFFAICAVGRFPEPVAQGLLSGPAAFRWFWRRKPQRQATR